MLFYFTSRIVCSVSAFLYPGYASYKTLAQRPASEEDIERWLMYWSVLGCIVAVEYVAEWLISWIPFYYFVKSIFLLYLALPQTRGSSYIYINHLQPFFHKHEAQIDATLASFKARIYMFIQERLRMLWEHVAATVGQQQREGQPNFAPVGGANNAGPPPTLGDPVSGPATLMSNLWQSYGPSIVASGAALLRQGATSSAGAAAASSRAFVSPAGTPPVTPPTPRRQDTSQSLLERRRQLEAELASLPPADASTSVPIPPASPSYEAPSRNSSDADLRGRSSSAGMKFEEIEVPSDVEGYDVGSGSGQGKPDAARRNSGWFGWGSPGKEGVEKAKSD